ncbi:AglZ/HisF2 family acetamidino modification protein [Vibrio cholerae]|uniref:AglZ/HisF2 family acetamidino modification protein n=1 Tax=Vibrio cholerae TaxID=666 RepID=UPI0002734656|nr:AglZ/HisF2 family acetamidino modification protein [Vibrio cholerae]GHW84235.1 imidazoleglycerol-phosphate synthase [Vibrio metoecus]EGQ9325615.1 imidazole glycerol phosphate synthase cyclase subunit [Vibrio cholerae]EGQ9463982.1 imidazole glycerol phosphate synthase cyclase subunit [Vibrio cholerae]EGR0161069.1 imidazole glycerol phosphate synthase cyclase subunit [Vibrio cholerae]EGR0519998.1 imidazole glycerol phosphate synthase cyclase subunit [Vibrio cholerae]
MLRSRIIPVLLMHEKGLVKTVKFKEGKYVGDPLNAVKIFNEQEADELILLDIDASRLGYEPDYLLIERIASECRMPLCYGGGVKSVEQAEKILKLGVEKVSLSSIVFDEPEIIRKLAERVGSQSVVVCLDIKKKLFGSKFDCFTLNGTKKQSVDPFEFISKIQALGVGEIVLNFIDNDGVMNGYDLDAIGTFKSKVKVPLTVVGGAGCVEDIAKLVKQEMLIGAAAGSLFVFKGKYKAVLINYPSQSEKKIALEL